MATGEVDEAQRDWLALSLIPGIGSTYFVRLLSRFREPKAVLSASEAALREVVGPRLAQRIRGYKDAVDLDTQLRLIERYRVTLITLGDENYPPQLAEIYDPPLALFVRGSMVDDDERSVAIVGTRDATPYGLRCAERLATQLAERGIAVVSGMALGIDASAHSGAMRGGGRTIAVFGCGVDIVYPQENERLMERILAHGAVVSSFPMGMKPTKGTFPARNRLISGLTRGTVVVEAPPRSGSLITARHAAEQGREVFAVPGPIDQQNCRGPHMLIREGAKLVESVEDILVELHFPAVEPRVPRSPTPAVEAPPSAIEASAPVLPPEPATPARATAATLELPPQEMRILSVLHRDGSFVDEIAARCELSVSEALSALTLLELKGLVQQLSGKRFAPR